MMKKFLTAILCFALVFVNLTACAAGIDTAEDVTIILQIDNPVMTVNGTEKEIDPGMGTTPVIINDRTLLPVRAVVEEIGGTVVWNGDTQEVTLSYGQDTIVLTIDSETAYLNGTPQALDAAPTIINDRTMLPIRFIVESFGYTVEWDGDTQTVTITKAAEISKPDAEPTAEPTQTPAAEPDAESTAAPDDNEVEENKMFIVYFSATGTTKALAETIAATTGADIVEIVPLEPYTSEDLNYNNDNCRANQEQNDASARPAISGGVENMEDYDILFLGYPIWWGQAPKIIYTFLESYDMNGKTIVPFCTSASSGIGSSATNLHSLCSDTVTWLAGRRFASGASSDTVASWINSLNLDLTKK